MSALAARAAARQGRADEALGFLGGLVPRSEPRRGRSASLPCHTAETLWLPERVDHVDERALREKVVAPDFGFAMVDGRLALARLCALQGRHDEAKRWFAQARQVLTGQGALAAARRRQS
jgi:hypothetical protein